MTGLHTYLNFDGTCRDAMTFYAECLGAELEIMPFSIAEGQFPFPEEARDRVIHARLSKGSAQLMASDTMPGMPYTPGNNFSVSVACETAEEVDRLYHAFLQGGKESMAPHDAFWGARFAALTDRFGVQWMFNFEYPKQ
mgnify:CR=1 FL=1